MWKRKFLPILLSVLTVLQLLLNSFVFAAASDTIISKAGNDVIRIEKVTIKSTMSNAGYLSVSSGGSRTLYANREVAKNWEIFYLVYKNDNTVSIFSGINNAFVSIEENGNKLLKADSSKIDNAEKFILVKNGNDVSFKAENNKYITVNNDFNLIANASSSQESKAKFTIKVLELINSSKIEKSVNQTTSKPDSSTSSKPSNPSTSKSDGNIVKIWIVPDTQRFSLNGQQELFLKHFDSMAKQVHDRDVDFILQMGDNTQGNHDSQWKTVEQAWDKINAKNVPYILNLGNHDTMTGVDNYFGDIKGNMFNKYFPLSKAGNTLVSSIYGNTNVAHVFDKGGVKWLVVSISWGADNAVIDWANSTIKKYPNNKVIIVNHEMSKKVENGVVKKNKNVVLFLGGHTSGKRELVNANGHKYGFVQTCFHSMLYDSFTTELEINTSTGKMSFRNYSCYYNEYWDESKYKNKLDQFYDKPWIWSGFNFK